MAILSEHSQNAYIIWALTTCDKKPCAVTWPYKLIQNKDSQIESPFIFSRNTYHSDCSYQDNDGQGEICYIVVWSKIYMSRLVDLNHCQPSNYVHVSCICNNTWKSHNGVCSLKAHKIRVNWQSTVAVVWWPQMLLKIYKYVKIKIVNYKT